MRFTAQLENAPAELLIGEFIPADLLVLEFPPFLLFANQVHLPDLR